MYRHSTPFISSLLGSGSSKRAYTILVQPVYTTGQICFDSIRLQEYVYTSGVESNQFDLGSILGTVFTRVVCITHLLIQSSSIRFDSSTTVRGGTIGIEAVRFDSCLHYE